MTFDVLLLVVGCWLWLLVVGWGLGFLVFCCLLFGVFCCFICCLLFVFCFLSLPIVPPFLFLGFSAINFFSFLTRLIA